MPSTLTRYTNRCSRVIRLDQQPSARYPSCPRLRTSPALPSQRRTLPHPPASSPAPGTARDPVARPGPAQAKPRNPSPVSPKPQPAEGFLCALGELGGKCSFLTSTSAVQKATVPVSWTVFEESLAREPFLFARPPRRTAFAPLLTAEARLLP